MSSRQMKGPGQRQVGRRLAQLHRAHRRGDDRAQSAPTRPRSTASPSVAAAGPVLAMLGGNVTVGGSGYTEFGRYIATKKMRPIAVTSPTRLKGVDAPTLKELGLNVEIGNWRGVYGAPGINAEQRKGAHRTGRQGHQTRLGAGGRRPTDGRLRCSPDRFDAFVDNEFASLRAVMAKAGMI